MVTVIAVPTSTVAVRSLSFSILKLLIPSILKTYRKQKCFWQKQGWLETGKNNILTMYKLWEYMKKKPLVLDTSLHLNPNQFI